MALALLVQSLTIFSPPESANAASPSDLLRGGIKTKDELLTAYDANTSGYKDLVTYAGITRQELEETNEGTFNSLDDNRSIVSWGHVSRFSEAEGEVTHTVKLSDGTATSIYSSPLWRWDSLEYTLKNGSTYPALIGHSKKNGWFAVMKNCANLAFKKEPTPPPLPIPPKPSPEPPKVVKITKMKTAYNLTQQKNAADTVAQAGDRIEYTLTIKNDGNATAIQTIKEHLTDVVEYATINDTGGGSYDDKLNILEWKGIKILPKTAETRKIVVELAKEIPATPRGKSDPNSYDCRMLNSFGNTVSIRVDCPTPKVIEQTVTELPKTGPTENLLVAGAIISVVTYFYVRSKQLNKEVRLVRKEFNGGLV